MYENVLLLDLLKNPVLIAALIALVRTTGGYVYTMIEAKKFMHFDLVQLGANLGVYETVFLTLSAVPSMPTEWIATLAVVVDVVRSFRKAVTMPIPASTPS